MRNVPISLQHLASCVCLLVLAAMAHGSDAVLWYDKPATDWEKEALPIGNGRMGAMVFGGVDAERLQISEKSLWTGGPGTEGGYDFGLPADSQSAAVDELGRQLLDGATPSRPCRADRGGGLQPAHAP